MSRAISEKLLGSRRMQAVSFILQYTPLLKKKMKGHFSDVTMRFVPQNLPPAFIFVCKSSNNHPASEKKAER